MKELNLLCLKLECKENNILDNIILYETVDIDVLDKLINSSLLLTYTSKTQSVLGFKYEYESEKQQLQAYRNLITPEGFAKVTYKKSDIRYGRSNPVKSLSQFSIRRQIRHTLSRYEYVDVDINNCHPTILYQIMKANNIECKCLESYVENREYWFDLIKNAYDLKNNINVIKDHNMLKDLCKLLFIRLLYGGSLHQWKVDSDINIDCKTPVELTKFIREVEVHSQTIADHNPNLYKLVKDKKIKSKIIDEDGYYIQKDKVKNKKKTKFNINGSVTSYFLQEVEIRILELMFIYSAENSYITQNNCVLCADGIMIAIKNYKPSILLELSKIVEEKTQLKLTFSKKAMDQDYLQILDKNLTYNLYSESFSTGVLSSYFKTIYSNKFLYNNGVLYEYNGVLWVKNIDKKFCSLHNFIDNTFTKHLINYITTQICNQNKIISYRFIW